YYFWVKSICGNTQTNWIPGGSFTTYSATGCNAPTQLYYDGLTSTTNNIAWVATTPAPSNGYVYCYSTINDPFSTGAITGTTSDTFAVLSNLSPNTTYYFWVKSICGNTQTNSVSGGSFTTQVLTVESFSLDKVKLYPNPVKTIFTISLDKEITTVSIYNLLGQEVLSKSVNGNETSVDVNDLTTGTYFVKVTSNNEVKTLKVIKQ
uniref:T9SS type A sorting domain-containing protein n=1 Tax=Flavobacterium facile TaxID=2893174 RepID=UPI002E78ADE5